MLSNKLLKNILFILIILVLIDIISKIIIYLLLPDFSEILIIKSFLSFYKTYNDTGLAGGTQSLLQYKSLIIIGSLLYFIFGFLTLFIKYFKNNKKIKFLIIVISIFFIIIIIYFSSQFSKLFENINNYFFVILRSIGPVLFVFSLFLVIKEKYVKIMFMMLLAGNIGNFLSSFYPPFKVVDFIRIIIPFSFDITEYTFSISDFIFNIADIYIFIFILLLLILPIYLLLKLINRLISKGKNKQNFTINTNEHNKTEIN